MAIFNSYVKLPEGKPYNDQIRWCEAKAGRANITTTCSTSSSQLGCRTIPVRSKNSSMQASLGVLGCTPSRYPLGFNIAIGNGPFIDGLPIKNGDFPWLC